VEIDHSQSAPCPLRLGLIFFSCSTLTKEELETAGFCYLQINT